MKHFLSFLRRLTALALVGLFMAMTSFTKPAKADLTDQGTWSNACSITNQSSYKSPQFKNPPYIYADYGKITMTAGNHSFKLDGDDTEFNGRLYDTTFYGDDGSVDAYGPLYNPPTLRVNSGKSINLALRNYLPLDKPLANLPPTETNLERMSEDTNLHYHGFNVSPLLGADDVAMHVHSNITPSSPEETVSSVSIDFDKVDSDQKMSYEPDKGDTLIATKKTSDNSSVTAYTLKPRDEMKIVHLSGIADVILEAGRSRALLYLDKGKGIKLTDGFSVEMAPSEPTAGGIYPVGDSPDPTYFDPGSIADYKMQINVPYGHQSGLFWYHPHVHTSSDEQVLGGMSGGIIVEGIDESYPIISGIRLAQTTKIDGKFFKVGTAPHLTEQVMLFKDFTNHFGTVTDPSTAGNYNCFALNGQLNPEMSIQPGEVQFWRVGNIGADTYLNLQLWDSKKAPVSFYLLARDSNVVAKPVKTTSVLLPPATRAELLVVGGKAGDTYNLVSASTDKSIVTYPIDYQLAKVKVVNEADICYVNTQGSALGAKGSSCGGESLENYIADQRPVKIDDILPEPKQITSFEDCQSGDNPNTCISAHRSFTFNTAHLDNSSKKNRRATTVFTMNGKLYDENRIDTVAKLGDVEEWTLVNADKRQHAYHMHQLDFILTQITAPGGVFEMSDHKPFSSNNRRAYPVAYNNYQVSNCSDLDSAGRYTCNLEAQGTRDNINLPPNSETVVRIPFLNPFITGVFVYHCHILGHEDRGMMQNIKVVDPNSYVPLSSDQIQ